MILLGVRPLKCFFFLLFLFTFFLVGLDCFGSLYLYRLGLREGLDCF